MIFISCSFGGHFHSFFMNQLFVFISLLLFSANPQTSATPDISGTYKLVKGTAELYGHSAPFVYVRGTLVVERLDENAFAYYGALTPKGYPTVGRTGVYEYRNENWVAEFPNRMEEARPADIDFRNDSLFVRMRGENAEEPLVWRRVPAQEITDKYQLKQIGQSRNDFKLEQDLKY
jgi:hypothetical protein